MFISYDDLYLKYRPNNLKDITNITNALCVAGNITNDERIEANKVMYSYVIRNKPFIYQLRLLV
jgi:hypothetical protein